MKQYRQVSIKLKYYLSQNDERQFKRATKDKDENFAGWPGQLQMSKTTIVGNPKLVFKKRKSLWFHWIPYVLGFHVCFLTSRV